MDLTQMQYFVLVAENGSTAKAAAEAMVSQSTVSKAILRLEREMDMALFDRKGIHLVLNPAGEEFLQQVRPILTAVKKLPDFVKSKHVSRQQYRINVGAAEAVMSEFVYRFFQQEPQAAVVLTDENWIDDCDLSISASPSGRAEDSVKLLEEEILLAVPMGMACPADPDVLSLEGLPLILPREGGALRQSIQREILSRPLVAEVAAVAATDETLRQLCLRGIGAAFWPEKTWPKPDLSRVRLFHLSGVHYTREIYALLPPEHPERKKSPLLEALIEFFKELDERPDVLREETFLSFPGNCWEG